MNGKISEGDKVKADKEYGHLRTTPPGKMEKKKRDSRNRAKPQMKRAGVFV